MEDIARLSDGPYDKMGAQWLKEFDDHPGDNIIEKAISFGERGLFIGGIYGAIYGAIFPPAGNVNGFFYSLRQIGAAGLVTGTAGLVLGAGVPIVQAIRKKDDPIAWGIAGLASGSVFGLRSGRVAIAVQSAFLLGVSMSLIKAAGTYREPVIDYTKHLRQPPKLYKLVDENGNIKTSQEW
nr:uncharacterized protein LOC105844705 [Hydra vulgaris]